MNGPDAARRRPGSSGTIQWWHSAETHVQPAAAIAGGAKLDGPVSAATAPAHGPREPGDGARERGRAFWTSSHQQKLEKASFLGVSTSPPPAPLREQLKLARGAGLMVDYVEKGSPADVAGLKQYDVLAKFNDQILIDAHQLAVLVRMYKAGDSIKLTAIHQGESRELKVTLIEKDVPVLDDNNPWGLPPGPWTREDRTEPFNMPRGDGRSVGRVNLPDGAELQYSDADHALTLSRKGPELHLLAKDKTGKVLFDGSVNTEKDREAVPPAVREKLKQLEIPGSSRRPPTTRPGKGE